MMEKTQAVFLDRDGVINKKMAVGEYVSHPREFELLPGVVDALKRLRDAGYLLIVVTNQRGIARGKVGHGDVLTVHRHMAQLLAKGGVFLDAVHYCPCQPGPTCTCRKPEPGMILRAAERFCVDLGKSWMVGDSLSDMVAGHRAGCQNILVNAALAGKNREEVDLKGEERPVAIVPDLWTASALICDSL